MLEIRRCLLVLLTMLVGSIPTWAQTDRGTITGTVTDATGAVVAGVSITVTNTNTGIVSKTTSGGGGGYTVPLLPVGT